MTQLDLRERLEREERLLELRNQGLSYREIGRDQGISHVRVRQIIERRTQRQFHPHVAEMRERQGAEIRELIPIYLAEAKEGHHAAVNAVVKLWERESKLFGLDAPAKHEVDTGSEPWMSVFDTVLVEPAETVETVEWSDAE